MSSVQFNLLPASKYKVMEVEAKEREIVRRAVQVAAACAALFILLLLYTEAVQKTQISSSTKSIADKTSKLEKVKDLEAILTIQNQLSAAATMHQSQHDTSRIFTYLSKLTPPNASVGNLNLDTATNTIKIDGTADTAATVNAFIDTMKYAQYKIGSDQPKAAFSSVVETNFSISQTGVSYSITASFDPNIFAHNFTTADGKPTAPQLVVPNSTTTRSGSDPGSLFGGNR